LYELSLLSFVVVLGKEDYWAGRGRGKWRLASSQQPGVEVGRGNMEGILVGYISEKMWSEMFVDV
jgi:hypothetical protein